MHTCCVHKVTNRYILKRWSKGIKETQSNKLIVEDGRKDIMVCSSVWRMHMGRNMNALLTANEMNREARFLCKEYFSKLKELVEVEVRLVYVEDNAQQDGFSSTKSILNLLDPSRSSTKQEIEEHQREKVYQAKARKKKVSQF